MNLVQHFWEVLEGGEGRTQWALDKMGLGHLAQEQAVVLSMGQVFRELFSQLDVHQEKENFVSFRNVNGF